MKYTRKDFIALAASAGAGSLLLGGLPGRRIAAHEVMPAEIINALEHRDLRHVQRVVRLAKECRRPWLPR